MANKQSLNAAQSVARLAIAAGALIANGTVGWLLAGQPAAAPKDARSWLLLGFGLASALLIFGVGYLMYKKRFNAFVKSDAPALVAVTAVGLMLGVGAMGDDTAKSLVDRVLHWAFVAFTVGLSELFVLFVVAAILGKIDLAQAFMDKAVEPEPTVDKVAAPAAQVADAADPEEPAEPQPGEPVTSTTRVSLARLQAFAWTLIIMIVYFHRVVSSKTGELPTIPPELLMVMGISGAVYLTSKEMGNRAEIEKAKAPKNTVPVPAPASGDSKEES